MEFTNKHRGNHLSIPKTGKAMEAKITEIVAGHFQTIYSRWFSYFTGCVITCEYVSGIAVDSLVEEISGGSVDSLRLL